jgi:hypothetical protein
MEYAFMFAGLLFLIIGLLVLKGRISFIKNGVETHATVIRIEVAICKTEEGDHTSYIPHFKAITHDEKEIIFKYGGSETWGKWSIGDQIKVVYNDSFPYDIVIPTFWGAYRKTVILLALAFVFLCIAGRHFIV